MTYPWNFHHACMFRRAAPQLPLWIRHSARGGLLVPHGDCPPQDQDNWGVRLRRRFVASAANSVSSVVVSAWPQYFAVGARAGCRGQDPSSTAKNLLQHPAQAQGRLFCIDARYLKKGAEGDPKQRCTCTPSTDDAIQRLKDALKENHGKRALEALSDLKVLADNKDCYNNGCLALELLIATVSPLDSKHGSGLDDEVVKESLAVACLLLKNVPDDVSKELWSQIKLRKEAMKTSLERIRDYCVSGSEYDEVRNKANEILTRPPSTPS